MTTAVPRERELELSLRHPAVLAVSGGADSMVMATALLDASPAQVVAIATFDHGTGRAATEAVGMVSDWARSRGVPVRVGHASSLPRTEAAWRRARWSFLDSVSAEFAAPVATAHTEDDQAETVLIRLLRQSGVRGLAALLAPGTVQRPMLSLSREAVGRFARLNEVPFHDDPSNADRRYLRNRVRLELLPALERADPGFRSWLLRLGRSAAEWRHGVAAAVNAHWAPRLASAESIWVPKDRIRSWPTEAEAALFWPEVAGRIGVVLDRRGTARLASFTTKREGGLLIPLSGGAVVRSEREGWMLHRHGPGVGKMSAPTKRRAPRDP